MRQDTPSSPASAAASPGRRLSGLARGLARDYAYILAGFPLAVISFSVLGALTLAAAGTLVVWIGALLMPLTLVVASGFAGLSRRRLRAWGQLPAPVEYQPMPRGLTGAVRLMADTRRWLDLAFETLFTLPLRLLTFVTAVTWTAVALGGVTYWFWWRYVSNRPTGAIEFLSLAAPGLVPQSDDGIYLLESGIYLALGAFFLLTLPAVIRGLAWSDALVTDALLSGTSSQSSRWAWASASFPAVLLIIVGWPVLAAVYGIHPAVAMVLTVSHSASLVLALHWPRASIGLSALAVFAVMLATSTVAAESPWPWPVTAILTQCVMVLIVALRHSWFWAVTAWTTGLLLTVAAFALIVGGIPDGGISNGVVLVSVTAGLTLLGIVEQLWRRSADRMQRAEKLSAEEAQRRRDLEERNRIARELHDVVAHSMSVINVQASTAKYRKPGIDHAVQLEFEDIAQSSRQALTEMRSLLAVLRSDDDAPTAPVPTLTDLEDLIEATRASGASISYSGVETDVPATVGLTAFRVIQEALSNALRHAPGASIEVTTAIDDASQTLVVEVINSAATTATAAATGAGLGLAGIRERVATLGGATVGAGPTQSGGFRVSTSLPLHGGQGQGA